jgi:hypothetical protein
MHPAFSQHAVPKWRLCPWMCLFLDEIVIARMFLLLNDIAQALADIKLTGEALKKKLVEELDR